MSSHWKKQRIQDHFVVLCSEMDVDRIVPVLRAERMLTSDEVEQLTNRLYTTRARREKLLLFIPRKGRAHFEKFAECLVWSGQAELAKKIGVPLHEIPPSPYPLPQLTSSLTGQQEEFVRMLHEITGGALPVMPTTRYPALTPTVPPNPHTLPRTPHPHPPPNTPIQETTPSPNYDHYHKLEPANRQPLQPIRRDTGPPKDVFILYCNDKRMKGDFSNAILLLSDFLTGVCGKGTKVHCDIYDDFRIPGNWNRWTEERITQSDVVLLVCSPTLIELLHDQDRPVQMKKGMFNAGMVYNLIQPPKFLPVFINDDPTMEHIPDIHAEPYSSWVPNHLKGTSRYWLDLEALHREMGNTDMMSTEEYWDRLSHLLSCHKKFEQIAGLLRDLQCTPGTQPPDPLPSPIVPLPTVHSTTPATDTAMTAAPTPQASRPDLTFTNNELMIIAQRIPRDWQNVGIKLGLMYTLLESIRLKHAFDCQQAAMEMFSVWRRSKGDQATRTALKDALMSVGYGRVVQDIFGSD